MCLEDIVLKRLGAPYRSGRSGDWLEVKNPDSPAMVRAREVVRTSCRATNVAQKRCMGGLPLRPVQSRNCVGCGNQQKLPRSTKTSQF